MSIEEVKIENIDPWTQTSKGFESLHNIEEIPVVVADQSYGKNNETIDAPIGLRNQEQGGKYFSGLSLRTTGAGTGLQSITGVGFTPKMIKIKAYKLSGYGVSDGTATVTSSNSFSSYESAGNLFTTYSNNIIYILDGSGASYCTVSSFDKDGFTLSWTLVQISLNFIYECYG